MKTTEVTLVLVQVCGEVETEKTQTFTDNKKADAYAASLFREINESYGQPITEDDIDDYLDAGYYSNNEFTITINEITANN